MSDYMSFLLVILAMIISRSNIDPVYVQLFIWPF